MDLMNAAGSSQTLLLGLVAVGALVVLAGAAMALKRRRFPLTALTAFPLSLCIAGAVAAGASADSALVTMGSMPATDVVNSAFESLVVSLKIDYAARWFAAFLLAGGVWAGAIGSGVAAGKDSLPTFRAAGVTGVLTLAGAGALFAYGDSQGFVSPDLSRLLIVLCVGGLGVSFASSKRAIYEETLRVAGMRFVACMSFMLSVVCATSGMRLGHRIGAMEGHMNAGEVSDLAQVFGVYQDMAAPVASLAMIAIAFGILIAFFGMVWEVVDILVRNTVLDTWATMFLSVLLFVVLGGADASQERVFNVASGHPATMLFEKNGPEYTGSLISYEREASEVSLEKGGFGDVLVWDAEAKIWQRAYAWDGQEWSVDCGRFEPSNQLGQAQAAYSTPFETKLTVEAASGVIVNDKIMGMREIVGNERVVMTQAPEHGNLTLNADGGFEYVPATNFDGLDAFSYEISYADALGAQKVIEGSMVLSVDCAEYDPERLAARRPLLSVASSDEALPVVRVLESLGDKSALLLMRAADLKAQVIVPQELAYMQTTFMEVSLSEEHDLTTDLWAEAGSRRVMWGPTYWYGEAEEEEPVVFFDAVYEETEAPGMHVLVGARSRVKDLANSCLPSQHRYEDDAFVKTERFCKLVGEPELDEEEVAAEDAEPVRSLWNIWRDEAAENTELFASEYTGLKVVPNKTMKEVLDGEQVVDRFKRELGAIEWCLNMLRDEGECIEGELKLDVTMSKKGKLSTVIDEKSKIQDGTFARCASKRFKDIEFEVPEEEEEEEEEDAKPKRGPEPEKPGVQIAFSLKTPPDFDYCDE